MKNNLQEQENTEKNTEKNIDNQVEQQNTTIQELMREVKELKSSINKSQQEPSISKVPQQTSNQEPQQQIRLSNEPTISQTQYKTADQVDFKNDWFEFFYSKYKNEGK